MTNIDEAIKFIGQASNDDKLALLDELVFELSVGTLSKQQLIELSDQLKSWRNIVLDALSRE